MPRPRIGRRVCCLPDSNRFGPLDRPVTTNEAVIVTVEEYEVIRLIDLEGLTQEECATRMGVARSTVQQMYQTARSKIAEAIVGVRMLQIQGGTYRLYDDRERGQGLGPCRRPGCRGRQLRGNQR